MADTADVERLTDSLRERIREIPDFPTTGILFRDVTPLLGDPAAFGAAVRAMAAPFVGGGITHVAAIESRGFLFGAPIALELTAGLIPLRKVGKLPFRTEREDYALEYGSAAIEAHVDACGAAATVLIVDDVLATGGTAAAACRLVERLGGRVAALTFLLSLDALEGERALGGRRVERLLRY